MGERGLGLRFAVLDLEFYSKEGRIQLSQFSWLELDTGKKYERVFCDRSIMFFVCSTFTVFVLLQELEMQPQLLGQ